jgi:hypothetical protein
MGSDGTLRGRPWPAPSSPRFSNHHRDRGPEVLQVLVELLPGTLSGVDVTVADDAVAAETVLPADERAQQQQGILEAKGGFSLI